MAIKKISELDTKAFLGKSGAAANSYVLVNYAENNNDTPVTYKATIDELSKAVANNLNLAMVSNDTIHTLSANSNNDGYNNSEDISLGGGGTLALTDSYPFLNDSGVLPIPMIDPNAYLMFAPVEEGIIGPPYIQLPGEETATPVNLAGPFCVSSSDTNITCTNVLVDYDNGRLSTIDPITGELADGVNSNYVGNFIKNATIDDATRDLHPLFIDTNNNTLYYFDNTQHWQTASL